MKKIGFILLIIITLQSCATLLNGNQTTVKISADTKSKIILKNDTISIDKNQTSIRPERSKNPLKITVLKDSIQTEFFINRKLSNTFWLNIFNYGLGGIVDLTNNNRFTYKHSLHFITDSVTNTIIIGNKKTTRIPKNKLFIYTSPLEPFDVLSIPMTTSGVEYFVKNNLSLSMEYGVHFPTIKLPTNNIQYLNENAFMYRFETKWYNGINLTQNVHLNEYVGFEIREIKSQYNDNLNYFEKEGTNQNTLIKDDFATKKRVTVINLKYGLLVPMGKKFYFDFYSGLGIRIKRFDHINLEYNSSEHKIEHDDFLFFDIREFKNYTKKILVNVSLGCKFGFNL